MDLITRFKVMIFFEYKGKDEFGNTFYQERKISSKPKRIVRYNGQVESSKIPPEWHSWLHHTDKKCPANYKIKKYDWQKQHLPNLSGTIHSYKPDFKKNKKSNSENYYQSWNPK